MTYAWRSERYSNCRSGYIENLFEISAEFRRRKREMPVREKLPHELWASPMHTLAAILRLRVRTGSVREGRKGDGVSQKERKGCPTRSLPAVGIRFRSATPTWPPGLDEIV